MRTTTILGVALVGGLLAVACGGGHSGGKTPNTAASASGNKNGGTSCKAASAAQPINKSNAAMASSTVALAKVGGKRVAYVADEDAKAVLTFDLDAKELTQIAETKVEGTPGQIYIAGDGRIFVTLRDKSELVVLSAAQKAETPLAVLCSTSTPNEPVAISATPDESTVIVTSGWGHALSALDAATLKPKFEAKLPREPRTVVVGDDGKTAFVSHAVGSIVSTVDLVSPKHEARTIPMRGFDAATLKGLKRQREMFEQMKKNMPEASKTGEAFKSMDREMKKLEEGRPSCQGFALAKSTSVSGRIFAPQVMVDPGDFDQRPDGYGNEHAATETPAVAVIDEAAAAPIVSSVTIGRDPGLIRRSRLSDARDSHPECLLPRAATIDAKSRSVLVTCFGIDAVIAYDATSANPFAAERRRWTVGSGPTGVAVDNDARKAVVWSQFDRTLSQFAVDVDLIDEKSAAGAAKIQKVAAAPLKEKLPAEYALGRILFHAAGDARIAADGRACASCHPDGRDDAITWATPEGPRRSIMLAGRASKTPPYSWNGNETTLHNHLGNTFDRLSGKGLRSIELDALVTYVSQMPAPAVVAPTEGAEKAKVERGKVVFNSAETGCATCHSGATYTDGRNHDVSSKHKADRSGQFNTPSLHLVGGTGPYFHDGRYTSLSELLTKSDGQMGKTKHLSNSDLDALESYLKTL